MPVQGLFHLFIYYIQAHLVHARIVKRNVNDSQRRHVYKRSISSQHFAARTQVRLHEKLTGIATSE